MIKCFKRSKGGRILKDRYVISSDKDLLDITVIHHFLCYHSYWGKGRSREMVQKSVDNSALCFGVYKKTNMAKSRNKLGLQGSFLI